MTSNSLVNGFLFETQNKAKWLSRKGNFFRLEVCCRWGEILFESEIFQKKFKVKKIFFIKNKKI